VSPDVHLLNVFADAPHGGNPLPVVTDADAMSDADMQSVARRYGHESGFVRSAAANADHDFDFRFWVPNHEMEMCGHATVGAVWMLDRLGRLPRDRVVIRTRSGRVEARVDGSGTSDVRVAISQPRGCVDALMDEGTIAEILDVLRISADDLAPFPIHNARTSRVKTTIPLRDGAVLDGLRPDLSRVEALCERIGSTGLYPYAVVDRGARVFDARQFPKSSGYP
jgi:PhzF family phenazine biosynthesis protein